MLSPSLSSLFRCLLATVRSGCSSSPPPFLCSAALSHRCLWTLSLTAEVMLIGWQVSMSQILPLGWAFHLVGSAGSQPTLKRLWTVVAIGPKTDSHLLPARHLSAAWCQALAAILLNCCSSFLCAPIHHLAESVVTMVSGSLSNPTLSPMAVMGHPCAPLGTHTSASAALRVLIRESAIP